MDTSDTVPTITQTRPDPGPAPGEIPAAAGTDLTGRSRMMRNVLTSWAAYLVYIVAGFVMPHLIDRHIGQESLGVWDFGWSLVSYFGLVSGGVTSAISRYVAHYRAIGETELLNTTVSTGWAMYLCTSLLVLGLTLLTVFLIPVLFATRLGDHVRDAQWVVFLLGISLVIQFLFSVFTGVIICCWKGDGRPPTPC
jgi:O-antigen/teichoic acid export membrane protein